MSFRLRFLFWGSLLFFLAACRDAAAPTATPVPPYLLITPNAENTATPTPFLPEGMDAMPSSHPTAIFLANATATPQPSETTSPSNTEIAGEVITATPNFYGNVWEDFPEPSYYPISTTIPYPVGMLPQPEGQVNILLLGSDIRPGSTDFRTDTIILLTIDQNAGKVNLTSFPRDLYVYIPGWTMQRINTAMAHGGYHTLGMTMAYNFGVYPDHYVMVDFSNFVSIINSLGGIDVEVAENFSDQRTGFGWYQVPKGTVHMDGDTALWYIRSRYTSSDIDRLRRAQEVIQAIGYRLLSFDVFKHAPELYGIYKDSVSTDIGLGDVRALLPVAKTLAETQEIHRYAIGYGPVYDWTEPYSGAMLLLPNRAELMPIMREALNVP